MSFIFMFELILNGNICFRILFLAKRIRRKNLKLHLPDKFLQSQSYIGVCYLF